MSPELKPLKKSKSNTRNSRQSFNTSADTKKKLGLYLLEKESASMDKSQLLDAVTRLEESSHCLLVLTPLTTYLGIEFNELSNMTEDELRLVISHLYHHIIKKPEHSWSSSGAQWFGDLLTERLHVSKYCNSTMDAIEDGEYPAYIHTVSIGFKSNDLAMQFLDFAYSKNQITLGGLRDNDNYFKTNYPFEVKAWGMVSDFLHQLKNKG